VKTLAAQASCGSFHGFRENDILAVALETPEHRGRVRGVSSSLGWGKGFGEEFARMYRTKRNKKAVSQMEELVGEAVTRIVSMLAESGIVHIPENVLHPPQSPPLSSNEEEDVHGLEEKDAHGSEEEDVHGLEEKMHMTVRKKKHVAERKTIGMSARAKVVNITLIVDHLC
jgi:hypothetical protein